LHRLFAVIRNNRIFEKNYQCELKKEHHNVLIHHNALFE
jgi:hypothetical protein